MSLPEPRNPSGPYRICVVCLGNICRSPMAEKILLTDLAHNLLAHFYHQALVGSPFEDYAPKRIVRDLLAIPGRLVFENHRLVRVELLSLKQFSTDLVECLQKYCADP